MKTSSILALGLALTFTAACDSKTQQGTGGAGGEANMGGAGPGGSGAGGGTSLPQSLTARAGVFIGSCLPDDGISRVTRSLYEGDFFPKAVDLGCFAQAQDGCASVEACVGITADAAGPCVPTCIGDAYEVCDDQLHVTVDCTVFDQHCVGNAGCSVSPSGAACDVTSFPGSCEGDVVVSCEEGVEIRQDCADHGLTCQTGTDGYAFCTGTGAACTGDGNTTCDGTSLVQCLNGGEHRIDCAALDPSFSCQTGTSEAFCGVADECDPVTTVDTCDGDDVVYCHGGRLERASCAALGFSRCEALGNGAICAPTGVFP
ncbi:MAG: hypothetical protein R3B72_07800 [Polyangiaceae bacterium]